MRRAGAAVLAAALGLPSGLAVAQITPQPGPPLSQGVAQLPFVTLDDDRLFAGSAWGKALLRRLEAEQTTLAAENRAIEARLADQERDLTARRPDLAPAEFRALADAFNAEVETWRGTQRAKEQALYQRHDAARLRFRDVANQVLAQLMSERGALAIISEDAIVLGFREIDITGDAVARLDALVGDGAGLPEPWSDPAPAEETPAPGNPAPDDPPPAPPPAPPPTTP